MRDTITLELFDTALELGGHRRAMEEHHVVVAELIEGELGKCDHISDVAPPAQVLGRVIAAVTARWVKKRCFDASGVGDEEKACALGLGEQGPHRRYGLGFAKKPWERVSQGMRTGAPCRR